MNLTEILTNNQFRRLLSLYRNIENRIKSADSSLIEEPDIVRLKDKTAINRSSEESILLALFPILIFVSYIILVIVFYGFYFSSDVAGFQRSCNMFIISVISLLAFYAYRGNVSALRTLNILNTLSIIFAFAILALDYFVYYMHHEWYLLTIVFFNFFSNRVIINSMAFSQAMTEILWFKTTNHILRGQIKNSSDVIEENSETKKKNIFTLFWQYSVLNTNLNNTLKISYELNQRVEKKDLTLLTHRGVTLGFKMLALARYLFIAIFALLMGLKFAVGMLDYSNVSLGIIAFDFLLIFFMLNTEYYCQHLRELHCFWAWHKVISNK
ncbi:hypothetical protein PSI19_02360 [Xenorhabdus khoisanae]|uniref:hypothetical protein n=1 Tax=Xenorhabdus khoisanae TaxID=880157 RepID=UPI0023598BD2|nr:hypothetical protein [Xenorhabdus khoisanae]MDC9612742.1 hypothetical protein [Xenorhabdus khoisanae]